MRLKEYSQKTSMDPNDRFVIDGDTGTKTVSKETVKDVIGTPPLVSGTNDGLVPSTSSLKWSIDHNDIFSFNSDGNSKKVVWKKDNIISVSGLIGHAGWYRVLTLGNPEHLNGQNRNFIYKISVICGSEIHEFYVYNEKIDDGSQGCVIRSMYNFIGYYSQPRITKLRLVKKRKDTNDYTYYLEIFYDLIWGGDYTVKEDIKIFCYGPNASYPPEPFIEIPDTIVTPDESVDTFNYNVGINSTPWQPRGLVWLNSTPLKGTATFSTKIVKNTFNTIIILYGKAGDSEYVPINEGSIIFKQDDVADSHFVQPIYGNEHSLTPTALFIAKYIRDTSEEYFGRLELSLGIENGDTYLATVYGANI